MKIEKKVYGKKQIAINMVANIVSFSSNILVSFFLTPFLIDALGKETYGFYPIANTIVVYLSVLANALNAMASRFVTVSLMQGKVEEANKYFSSTLVANLTLSAILFVPMSVIVIFLEHFMDVPINSIAAIKILFALVFSSAIINISAALLGIATFAKNRIDLRSFREIVTAFLKLILFYVLYRFLTPSIIYVGIVALVVALVNTLFQAVYTKYLLPEVSIKFKNASLSHTKELLSSSCWNAINSFGNTLLAGMSMILANMFYGAEASGSYSIVHVVPHLLCSIIIMLVGIFYPVITYRYATNDKQGLIKEIKIAQSIVGLFGCLAISVFSALSTEFFLLWTPKEDAVLLSQLSFYTILPHFIIACMWSLTNLNIAMNKVKIPALFTLGSGLFNILVAFITYKIFQCGLVSLPIISSVLQIIWVGIFIPLYACRNLKVNWSTFYPPLIKALVFSVCLMIVISHVKNFFVLNSWFSLFCFAGLVSVLSVIVLAGFHIKELKGIYRKV